MTKKAIITGITGQDGAYMSKLLIEKGYQVYGTFRRTSSVNFWRLEELGILDHERFELVDFDLTDAGNAISMVDTIQPDEIYNLAAQSFVEVSFSQPNTTTQINGLGTLNLLEAIKIVKRDIRFYQASTSEQFGKVQAIPQNETTPFYPRSPYAVAKLYAHWMTINYRESYDLFAVCGILFNHESPLRGQNFVTRKITHAVAKIKAGELNHLELGNLNAKRDWGYTGDYVEGMYQMIQCDTPHDLVLATGRSESVRDFASMAFKAADIEIDWQGEGLNEVGIDTSTGQTRVQINEKFYRPAEVDLLIGDASKANTLLGWKATTTLETICHKMVEADMQRTKEGHSF